MSEFFSGLDWSGYLQIVLMIGVLAYGLFNRLTGRPFDLFVFIFWMVCSYIMLIVLMYFVATMYRGDAADQIMFGLSQFLDWAMTIVLFAFLPMTILAALANKWSKKSHGEEDGNEDSN